MKKLCFALVVLTVLALIGCIQQVQPPKEYTVDFPKIKKVFIDNNIGVYKNVETIEIDGNGGRISLIFNDNDITSDPKYTNLAKLYIESLAENFQKDGSGFIVLDKPEPNTIILKTKIGYRPPRGYLGGAAIGVLGFKTDVYVNDKIHLSFDSVMNTGRDIFLEITPETQVQSRYLHERTIRILKEKFIVDN